MRALYLVCPDRSHLDRLIAQLHEGEGPATIELGHFPRGIGPGCSLAAFLSNRGRYTQADVERVTRYNRTKRLLSRRMPHAEERPRPAPNDDVQLYLYTIEQLNPDRWAEAIEEAARQAKL